MQLKTKLYGMDITSMKGHWFFKIYNLILYVIYIKILIYTAYTILVCALKNMDLKNQISNLYHMTVYYIIFFKNGHASKMK